MRKAILFIVLAAVFALAIRSDKFQPTDTDSIIWLGKGVNWDFQIKLVHKPNDQVKFISHARVPAAKPCEAPDYAVEVSEGLFFNGRNGGKFTSFKVVYEGIPPFLNPVSEMSIGDPHGIENGKPYGTEHSACFTKAQWERMEKDTSNMVKVTVTAYPYDNSSETVALKTSSQISG